MNKHGQSFIEYALIAVLVILGIVIMGPYVLRSVNAHFKLWNDSAQDSFSEHLTQAPVNDIPNVNIKCDCKTTSTGQCGSSVAGGQGSCGPNQMIYSHDCTPQSCDGAPASSCKDDDSCCGAYSPTEACGTVTIPAGDTDSSNDANQIPTGPPPTPSSCYWGQKIWATQCGTMAIQCHNDSSCNPQCLGNPPAGAVFCPNTTNLDKSYLYNSVPSVSACDPNAKCQYYAPPPYIVGISFKLQNFTNTGFGTCRLRKNNNGIFDEGGDSSGNYGWAWTLNYTTGVISYGQGEPLPYLPILELKMSNGTISEVALENYPSGGTLPGDWTHINNASITLTQWLPIKDSSDYLTYDLGPSQIGIEWKDNGNNDRSMNCWDMCVNVNTNDGNGIHGC